MNSPLPPGLDLSKLPEPIRSKLQARLDKLPPEMRAELLQRGAPMIDRAIERAQQGGTKVHVPAPKWFHGDGRYNATVQPGDRIHLSLTMIAMVVAAAFALYYLD